MEETATQTGVEESQPQDERSAQIAEIAARARQERDNEMKLHGFTPVDTSGTPESEEAPVQVKAEEAKEEVTEVPEQKPEVAETVKPEPVEKLVTIKVDGVEKQVPEEQIIEAGRRALQKESAADQRLAEATRILKEAQETIQKPQQNSDPSLDWDDQTIAYALANGNEEQKQEAVRQMLERQGKLPTPDVIAQSVTEQVLDTVDFQSAATWFKDEYKDIVGDPYLLQLAASREMQLRNEGDTRPRRELFKTIGDELRKWRGGNVVTQTLETKKEAKSNIVSLPAASVRKQAPEEQKPKTPSQIIEEMAKRRGQA